MRLLTYVLFAIMVTIIGTSCTKESELNCDQQTMVNDRKFENGPSDFLTITDASIFGSCLKISFSASGCSGQNWKFELLASSAVAESFPVQRFLRLSMDNPEDCLAVFTREVSFDLSSIELDEYETIILNLQDWPNQIRYEY